MHACAAASSSAGPGLFVLPSGTPCLPRLHLPRLPHGGYSTSHTAPSPWSSSSWGGPAPPVEWATTSIRRCGALKSKSDSNDALDTATSNKPWLPFLALMGVESAILGPFLDDFHGRTGVLIYRDPVSVDVGSLHILGSAAWVRFVVIFGVGGG